MEDVTALILVGGQGTRLRGTLPGLPKVLAPVCGRPFLSYLLDQVLLAGVSQAVLCAGYLADQIIKAFGTRYGNLEIRYSSEPKPLGTAGALRLALAQTKSPRLLVLNGDSYVHTSLAEFDRWHVERQSSCPGALLLTWRDDTSRYGTVELGPGSMITSFREKCTTGAAGWINAGAYLISRPLLESIDSDREISIEREMFPLWLDTGLGGFTTHAPLIDIGTPESYAQASAFMTHALSQPCQPRAEPTAALAGSKPYRNEHAGIAIGCGIGTQRHTPVMKV